MATGTQVEVDAYPRLGHGTYLYLNAGLSGASIFPGQRLGAEYYAGLGYFGDGLAPRAEQEHTVYAVFDRVLAPGAKGRAPGRMSASPMTWIFWGGIAIAFYLLVAQLGSGTDLEPADRAGQSDQ